MEFKLIPLSMERSVLNCECVHQGNISANQTQPILVNIKKSTSKSSGKESFEMQIKNLFQNQQIIITQENCCVFKDLIAFFDSLKLNA